MRFIAAGSARDHGAARLPHRQRNGRPHRPPRAAARPSTTGRRRGLDFCNILYQPDVGPDVGRFCQMTQDHGLDKSLDLTTLLRPLPAGPRARRKGHRRAARSATSTASSAPSPAAKSRSKCGAAGPARRHHPAPLQRLRRPELRRVHAARHDASSSKATPTITSARACPAARSSSIRPRAPPSSPRRTSSSATSRSTARPAARPTSAAWPANASRPQHRRQRRRRSRRRPRLRIHDRRPRRRARAAPAATSPPACPAASPTCSTRPAISPRAATRRWSALEKLDDADEIAAVRATDRDARSTTPSSSARASRCSPTGNTCVPKFVKVMPKDYKRMLGLHPRARTTRA